MSVANFGLPDPKPVEVMENLRLPTEGASDADWQDILQAMVRHPGCLIMQCRRTAEGYCLCSRWATWRDFVDWNESTLYTSVASRLPERRITVHKPGAVLPVP